MLFLNFYAMLFVAAALVQKTMVPPHYDLTSPAKSLSYLTKDLRMPSSISNYQENKYKMFHFVFYWV